MNRGDILKYAVLTGLVSTLKGHDVERPLPANSAELTCEVSNVRSSLPIEDFQSQPERVSEQAVWPSEVVHPFSKVKPTFDDGPDPHDTEILHYLKAYPFEQAIFYYNGVNFFKVAPDVKNGEWMVWLDRNRGDQPRESFLRAQIDPEKAAIVSEVLAAHQALGFHGMKHSHIGSGEHPADLSYSGFASDIAFFEELVKAASGAEDYRVKHVRPPFGEGMDSQAAYLEYCKAQDIEVRNWALSSFDWDPTAEVRGEAMLRRILPLVAADKHPDILYHSRHQGDRGSFFELMDGFSGEFDSLLLPERQEERRTYKTILEQLMLGQKADTHKLSDLQLSLNSTPQILADSAYNTELKPQWVGSLQTAWVSGDPSLELNADGYVGGGTLKVAGEKGLDRYAINSPNTFFTDGNTANYPDISDLMDARVSFANRGLQVRKIANDIVCHGGIDAAFLGNYEFMGLYIEPSLIPEYLAMNDFYQTMELNLETRARLLATALLETGVKNNWDKLMIGKASQEKLGQWVAGDWADILNGPLNQAGQSDLAYNFKYGPRSVGLAQMNVDYARLFFSLILERDISREEARKILETPEGAAFTLYIKMRQIEGRMVDERI